MLDEPASSDGFSEYRQIGIIDRNGHEAVFTGNRNKHWAGSLQGPGWIAMGNYLKSEHIVDAMTRAFHDAAGEILEERLMRAIEAGRDAGGERGASSPRRSSSSGATLTPAPICASTGSTPRDRATRSTTGAASSRATSR